MLNPKKILHRLVESEFAPFEGARLEAEIPLTETLLNQAAAEQSRSAENLESLYIHLPGNNNILIEINAKVSAKLFGLKVPVKRKIHFQIEREVMLSPSPTIRLRLVDGLSGLEKAILRWLENLISRMVPGEIALSHDTLSIDLGPEVRKQKLDKLVGKLQKVTVESQPQKLIIKFRGAV